VAAAAVGGAGGLASYGVFRAYAPAEVTELALRLPRLPRALDGLTLVQVTDIHAGPLIRRPFLVDLVARCNGLRPDLVAITGDLVDGDVPTLGPAVSALADLRSRYGTYFVTGNHGYYSGDVSWSAALERWGVQTLRNRRTSVGDAGASLDLIGVDDWQGRPGQRYDLMTALQGRDPDRASVLLAHQPRNFDQVAEAGVGLQLSGHTHGGQLFPMTLAIGLIWQRPAGLYPLGSSHLYVSRGTGFWGPPMRVGSPPEIVKITLLAG
jgi:predicted MPP superfamily phosphohydrolase